MSQLYIAAKALLDKVRADHPNEELYEPVMRNLDQAVIEYEAKNKLEKETTE